MIRQNDKTRLAPQHFIIPILPIFLHALKTVKYTIGPYFSPSWGVHVTFILDVG